MGNNQSEITQQVAASFTEILNTAVSSVLTEGTVTCSNNAEFKLCIGCIGNPDGSNTPCPLNFNGVTVTVDQNSFANCSLTESNTTSITDKITTSVTNNVTTWVNQSEGSVQGWLTFAFNTQAARNYTKTELINRIVNGVSEDISTQCSAALSSNAELIVPICGNFNNVNFIFQQDSITQSLTGCINNTVLNNVLNDTVINAIVQETNQNFKSTQEGPLDLLKVIVIIIAIIVGLLIIGGIVVAATTISKV